MGVFLFEDPIFSFYLRNFADLQIFFVSLQPNLIAFGEIGFPIVSIE